MKAHHDAVVVDHNGRSKKVFAGQPIPSNLIGAYREAVGEAKAETAPETHKAQLAPEHDKAQAPVRRRKRVEKE